MRTQSLLLLLLLLLSSLLAPAQTRIDLSGQSKAVDLRAAEYTRPVKTGELLPATCKLGELFYLTSAAPGANLHGCITDDVWAAMIAATPPQSLATQGGFLVSLGETGAVWMPPSGDIESPNPGALSVVRLRNRLISASTPAIGQALIWDGSAWTPQSVNGGSGALQLLQSGSSVGTRSVLNVQPGLGIVTSASDSGSQINVTWDVDPAVVATKTSLLVGQPWFCNSTPGTGNDFACDLTPAPISYTAGLLLHWIPPAAITAGTPVTLAVGPLDPVAIKLADGVSDPLPGDLPAGQLLSLWYDGTVFRLRHPETLGKTSLANRPACVEALRGRFWHVFAGAGDADEVAVCAKGADNVYTWRPLY